MSPLFKKARLYFVTLIALLLLGGCSGDGKNASDNPSSAPQLVSNSGPGDGITATLLPQAGAPLVINSDTSGSVDTAKAVIDGSGNVTVVWTQSDGTHVNLWSSRYVVANTGWSNAQKLESGTLDVKSFQLVVDAARNVTVVWSQATADSYPTTGPIPIDVERTDLWAVRFDAVASGWTAEGKIESADLSAIQTQNIEDIGEFRVVVASSGDVSVLWTQHNGSRYDLYATRNVAGVWDVAPALIDSENLGDVSAPQLVVDSTGKLFALWSQSDGALLNLWGAHYATGWSAATKLDSEDQGDVETPKIVVDNNGDATVVWRQFDGQYWSLWTTRYSGAWGVAAMAESLPGDVDVPQLLLYGTVKVMLLWAQSDGAVNNIWSRRYDADWVDEGLITDGAGDSGSVVMVKDQFGVVTAAWVQHSSSVIAPVDDLWANRFDNGWGTPAILETDNGDVLPPPLLSVDSTSRVSAIWLQREGGRFDLWSNHYSLGSWGAAGLVEGMNEGSVIDPRAVMSSGGNITLAWRQPYNSGTHLVTNKYTVGTANGWGTVASVESASYDSGYDQQLLVDGGGIISMIWLQPVVVSVGVTQTVRIDLWANRF